jgi:hypothetical protein
LAKFIARVIFATHPNLDLDTPLELSDKLTFTREDAMPVEQGLDVAFRSRAEITAHTRRGAAAAG